jgi:hypothetical protein
MLLDFYLRVVKRYVQMILIFTFMSQWPLLKEKGGRSDIFNVPTNLERKLRIKKNFSCHPKFKEIL